MLNPILETNVPTYRTARPRAALIAVAATALLLALTTAVWNLFPHVLKDPLIGLNRQLAGLQAHALHMARHDLHYLDGGAGEPVVLLHGIFAEKDHWVDTARHLTPHHRVLVPDLPGFGASDRHADEAYGYADQVPRLRAFLDALGIERAHLAGSSMGGTLATLFALSHPERVASLALIGAPHGLRTPVPSPTDVLIDQGERPLIARDDAEFEALMARLFVREPWLPHPVRVAARDGAIAQAASNERLWREHVVDRDVLHDRLPALRTPTLVLWGAQDRVFHRSGAALWQRLQPAARVQVLDNTGHLPMMEAPADTAQRLRTFLQQHPLHAGQP